MILGIGIDTIEIARVLRACERSSHFVERTFTTKEMAQFAEHKVRKASDFAAKEAVAKAFVPGFTNVSRERSRCSGENWRNRMCGCMERQKR